MASDQDQKKDEEKLVKTTKGESTFGEGNVKTIEIHTNQPDN